MTCRALVANIPEDFWDVLNIKVTVNQDVFNSIIAVYCTKINAALRGGHGIFLFGDNGCGKTTFLNYVLMQILRKTGYSCYSTTALEYKKNLQRSWDKQGASTAQLRSCMERDFLLIDEFCKDRKKNVGEDEFMREEMEGILRWRYQNRKPTLIASNLDIEGIDERYRGNATFSSLLSGRFIQAQMEAVDMRQHDGDSFLEEMGL